MNPTLEMDRWLVRMAKEQWREPTYTDEERRMFEERLNAMSRAEFAAFVRDLTVDTVVMY